MKITHKNSISLINKSSWDAITSNDNPFQDYDWLLHLENTRCTHKDTGWEPVYFTLTENDELKAAIIAYKKHHSYGEFIFDWQWAQSYYQAGINYYPKLVLASAFTPAGNRRLLNKEHSNPIYTQKLLDYVIEFAKEENLSSIHSLFCPKQELNDYNQKGFITRYSYQFHFKNNNFSEFNDYLNALKSQKRKSIKKERQSLKHQNIQCNSLTGNEITTETLDYVWQCYQNTIYEKSSTAYLNKPFFLTLPESIKQKALIIIAKHNNSDCACTFNLFDNNTLYGRYWGATHPIKFLHFECSLYQLIKWAIKNNLKKVEAGAQGEHKFLRGFEPSYTYSAHLMLRKDAQNMVKEFTTIEKKHIDSHLDYYKKKSPFKD